MNWKLGLTRLYYVLWILWGFAWIYWSALNLVHYGPPRAAVPVASAAEAGYIQPPTTGVAADRQPALTPRSMAKGVLSGSIVFEPTGAPRWYFMPRPSTGQLLMLSMIGAAFPGALLLAGRWVTAGFKASAEA